MTLASQSAVVLRRARTYEVEHEVASTLQRAMLPESLPEPMGFRVQGRYRAATGHLDVGGDWFDAVELGVDRLALVVGDVVGRGLPAATAMGQLRTAWRALVVHGAEPGEAMEGLEAFAASTIGAECTTVAAAVIDGGRGVVRYACAGHLPPLVVSRDGRTRYLTQGRRPPLGVTEPGRLVEGVEPFYPGETLLLYTDGLVERRHETLDDGLARLSTVASGLVEQTTDRMSDELIDRLTRGSALADDVALLVVRALPVMRRSTPARPERLADMRAEMRSWLGSQGVADAVIADVVLAAGEAAANSLEHGYVGRADAGPLEWGMSLEAGRGIVVSVRDRGTWRGAGADPDRGNGLKLIRALMDDVDIDSSARGTTVTMSRRIEDRHAVV